MKELLDIVQVKPYANYQLLLEFENGEKRLFDMKYIIDKRPFNRLKNSSFMAARVEHGTVVWPGNIDIAPETLYDKSVGVQQTMDSYHDPE
nr:DUF2442 domain-containing protein [Desulfobacula sp.]